MNEAYIYGCTVVHYTTSIIVAKAGTTTRFVYPDTSILEHHHTPYVLSDLLLYACIPNMYGAMSTSNQVTQGRQEMALNIQSKRPPNAFHTRRKPH